MLAMMSVTPGYELFCYHSTAIYFINLIRRPNCSVACLINSVFCLIQQFDGIKYSTDIVGVNPYATSAWACANSSDTEHVNKTVMLPCVLNANIP